MGCVGSDAKAARARAFGRAGLECYTGGSGGSTADGRADVGRGVRGSTTRATFGSRQLGSNCSATRTDLGRTRRSSTPGRAHGAVLGRAAARCAGASRSRGAFGTGPSRTTASRPGGTRTDLGIASRRDCGAGRARHGCRGLAPAAFMGRCTASCRSGRSSRDRLGRARSKRRARDAACALVERAGWRFLLGRPQDRGAGRPRRAVVVGPGPGSATGPSGHLGSPGGQPAGRACAYTRPNGT